MNSLTVISLNLFARCSSISYSYLHSLHNRSSDFVQYLLFLYSIQNIIITILLTLMFFFFFPSGIVVFPKFCTFIPLYIPWLIYTFRYSLLLHFLLPSSQCLFFRLSLSLLILYPCRIFRGTPFSFATCRHLTLHFFYHNVFLCHSFNLQYPSQISLLYSFYHLPRLPSPDFQSVFKLLFTIELNSFILHLMSSLDLLSPILHSFPITTLVFFLLCFSALLFLDSA